MPALLTSACRQAPSGSSRSFTSAMPRRVSSGSERSTWRWSPGPISQGQFSGKACREQVMTRQPAAENRLTVAWPMPRLAPVSSMTRRPWFEVGAAKRSPSGLEEAGRYAARLRKAMRRVLTTLSGIEPALAPALAILLEQHAVVQPKRPVLPELHRDRHDPETGPIGRARHL